VLWAHGNSSAPTRSAQLGRIDSVIEKVHESIFVVRNTERLEIMVYIGPAPGRKCIYEMMMIQTHGGFPDGNVDRGMVATIH